MQMMDPSYMPHDPSMINPNDVKVTGTLKFFFNNENYGFLVGDGDNKDVFFHFDDMINTGMT